MSSPIVVPFNFDPIATTVRTANYTIPAGRYARVTPLYSTAGSYFQGNNGNASCSDINIQLNGAVVYRFPVAGSLSTQALNVVRTLSFPANGKIEAFFGGSSAMLRCYISGAEINGSFGTITQSSFNISAMGSSIGVQPTQSGYAMLTAKWQYLESISSFFAKSGDIITISAASSYLTEEYNRIS